jgi:hypothetical protein
MELLNQLRHLEVLDKEALPAVQGSWEHLVRAVGVRCDHPERDWLVSEASQDIDGTGVHDQAELT